MANGIIWHRWVVRGTLELTAPFRIGSGQASDLSDLGLQRDAAGQPYLPGSSLAGLLRSAATELAPYLLGQLPVCRRIGEPGCPICALFGFAPEGDAAFGGEASRLWVEDARPLTLAPATREVRDHVGLNRERGAAEPQLLFNHEVAPGGMQFHFEISVEDCTDTDLQLLGAVLRLWKDVGLQVGGRATTGLGQAKLGAVACYGLDFANPQTLRDYLLPAAEALPSRIDFPKITPLTVAATPPREDFLTPQFLCLELALTLEEPLLMAGGAPNVPTKVEDYDGADHEFLQTVWVDATKPYVIPGSSFKGALRTRAEKILRTLRFHQMPAVYAQYPGACAVTHTKESEALCACVEKHDLLDEFKGKRPAQVIAETIYKKSCPACRLFGNSAMRGRLSVGETIIKDKAEATAKLFDHVAIDRFTGGAADAKKFDTRPLLPGAVARVQWRIDRPEAWMWGLLYLLLRDLAEGDLRLGHATHRGYGKVTAQLTQAEAWLLPNTSLSTTYQTATGTQGRTADFTPYWRVSLLKQPNFDKACHQAFLKVASEYEKPEVKS